MKPVDYCDCCGSTLFKFSSVLWPELTDEWGLSKAEEEYINRQQGGVCQKCGNSLRSIALAKAILSARGCRHTFRRFLFSPKTWTLKILELNGAGTLARYLSRLPRTVKGNYPDVDMQKMPYKNDLFDLVLHSDTLEHVPNPVTALSECLRVLKPGGFCCFTIPIIVGRTTKSRSGLKKTYHGGEGDDKEDYLVETEYGSDFWIDLFEAGFTECRIVTVEYPAAQAIAARKPQKRP